MKVGSIVLATEQGLGYLAKDFYDNGIIDVVYIHPHTTRKNHYEWYDNTVKKPEDLLDCDVILFFETPFHWDLIPKAREKGTKTVLMPMYECTNDPLPFFPDLIITPSDLDKDYYPDSKRINVPIPKYIEWKQRNIAKTFVHNAGNGGLGGRNGTKELLEAMKYVKSPIRLILRSQEPIKTPQDNRIDLRVGTFEDIWSEGDVFVFPEKFNGLSLPIQEAFASGMLIMTTDRHPNNKYLPTEPLIPVQSYKKEKVYREFDVAEISPVHIANTIDKWYNKDITKYSLLGRKFKEENSWDKLKDIYRNL